MAFAPAPRPEARPDELPPATSESALDRARRKAYWRLLPLCFLCYVIAYVDRANVSIAKLTMTKDLAGFDNAVIGWGAGMFFWGYFMLEIPGTLLVEKWSARKWISRIMVSWGIMAALTALVTTPFQFYVVRFLLGLAEAGFYPGVIVYLTHWFPVRDRARALAYFFVATPDRPDRQPEDLGRAAHHRHRADGERSAGSPSGGARPRRLAVGLHRLGHSRGRPRGGRVLLR